MFLRRTYEILGFRAGKRKRERLDFWDKGRHITHRSVHQRSQRYTGFTLSADVVVWKESSRTIVTVGVKVRRSYEGRNSRRWKLVERRRIFRKGN